MTFWHGTRLRTSWLRLRGSASGRRSESWICHFFCEGCQRAHGSRIMRVQVGEFLLCQRDLFDTQCRGPRYLDAKGR